MNKQTTTLIKIRVAENYARREYTWTIPGRFLVSDWTDLEAVLESHMKTLTDRKAALVDQARRAIDHRYDPEA